MSHLIPSGHHDAETSRWWEATYEMQRAATERLKTERDRAIEDHNYLHAQISHLNGVIAKLRAEAASRPQPETPPSARRGSSWAWLARLGAALHLH